jgi:hypothetical protein
LLFLCLRFLLFDWLLVPLVVESVPLVLLEGIVELVELFGSVPLAGEFGCVWLPGVSDEAGGVVDGLDWVSGD